MTALARVYCETCGEETLHKTNCCVHCGRERLAQAHAKSQFNGAVKKGEGRAAPYMVTYQNRLIALADLARITSLPPRLIYRRWRKGLRGEDLVKPVQHGRKEKAA